MPSAAKLEKRASSNQAESIDNNNCTPIRQALVIIEHKIRNLEKRKTKLESYREIQASGKELSNDQKAAVAKFDEVAQCLEFARELSKQMLQLATISEKEQKKQARKDIIARAQAETAKIREVLIYQDILSNLSISNIREDFLNGTNGAVKLEEEELKTLEKFYIEIQVKRQETPEDPPITVCAQKAAEYLSLTIDGRPKQYGETTFESVRKILQNIQDCGYFDKKGKVEDNEENKKEDEVEKEMEASEKVSVNESNAEEDQEAMNNVVLIRQQQQQPLQDVSNLQPNLTHNVEGTKFPAEAPSAAAVPAPAFPQQSQVTQTNLVGGQIQTQTAQLPRAIIASPITASIGPGQVTQVPPPVAATPGNAIHFPPTTVRAVEQAYYKQHQYIQQMRPLAEVIGSGNFFFLQDSELDSPDVAPGGFTSTENQNTANNIVTANVPQQSPNAVPGVMQPHQTKSPQQPVQQGQPKQVNQQQGNLQPQIPLPQSTGVSQKTQTSNPPPIPTQTFTNQSFPQVVPPTPIFPVGVQNPDIVNPPHQIPVFAAAPLPLPQIVAQQPQVVAQAQGIGSTNTENPHPQQLPQGNLITGPSGSSIPLPGFPPIVKFSASNAPLGMHQVGNQLPPQDKFDPLQNSQKSLTDSKNVNKVDEPNDRTKENANDWDSNEKSHRITSSSNKTEIEGNQWSNETAKNDWSNTVNQNETNTWNNSQSTDNYNNRGSRNTFSGNNRMPGGNSGSNRGIRSGSGPPSNGYRTRSSNSYQQQQNGRNSGVYFRNNEGGGYFQNQNNNYNSGNKSDSSNNYSGNLNPGNYRSRGSGTNNPMSQPNRLQSGGNRQGVPPSLQNTGPSSRGGNGGVNNNTNNRTNLGGGGPSNPNANRPVRNSGTGGGGAYGSSRPPNVRQPQQDVNA